MSNLPPSKNYDVIVVGAGHNGLVAAAYLAKAGLHVLVVEQRETVGGAAGTSDIFPGYQVDVGATDAGLFTPEIIRDLNLESRGLRWLESPAVVTVLQADGHPLTVWRDPVRTAAEIAPRSKTDAERYPSFLGKMTRFTDVLQRMLTLAAPSLPDLEVGELLPWLGSALRLKSLGDRDMMELLRVLPMPVSDWLEEWFQDGLLKAAIAAGSVRGHSLGPMSSGTSFLLLYHAIRAGQAGVRSCRFVQGGMGLLTQSLASAASQYGAEIRTGQGVASIIVEDGRATGILLENEEQVAARAVVSNADPRRTFFDLVGAANLPVGFVREVKNIRFRSSLARVSFALNGMPDFSRAGQVGSYENLSGHNLVCPSLEYLERAYDEAKYGGFSSQPVLDILIPSLSDPTLAPPGSHLMNVDMYYAPYAMSDGGWDDKRAVLLDVVIKTLEDYAPGIQDMISHSHVLTPLDLEREFGLTNGDIYHGQMGLDQLLMMRPVPGYGRYRTPVENLYLCGAGTHPGGGVTGASGYNAAREIRRVLTAR